MTLDDEEKKLLAWLVSTVPQKTEAHFHMLKRGWVLIVGQKEYDTELISLNMMESLAEAGLLSFTDQSDKKFYRLRIKKEGYELVDRKFKRKTDIAWLTFWVAFASLVGMVGAFLYTEYMKPLFP